MEVLPTSLLYLEKLMLNSGNLMNSNNWRKLVLTSLLLAAKVISDTEIPNAVFSKAVQIFSLEEINELERIFIQLLEYKLHVNGGEYAKYYLVLRVFAEEENIDWKFKPTSFHMLDKLKKGSDTLQKYWSDQLLSKTH